MLNYQRVHKIRGSCEFASHIAPQMTQINPLNDIEDLIQKDGDILRRFIGHYLSRSKKSFSTSRWFLYNQLPGLAIASHILRFIIL